MKRIILLFASLVMAFHVLSQNSFSGKSPLRSPAEFEKPRLSTQLTRSKPGRNIWAVWADRDNIVTSNGKKLQFAARFLVVEEKQDIIHIVDEKGTYNSVTDEFLGEPEDYGWVSKSSMLLWPTALYSDKTNFRIKVMTITTPSEMKNELQRISKSGKKLSFYSNPETETENDNELPLFEIFYVFKKEGTRLLLGRRDNISRGNATYYLMGWADESKVQLWELRQVLEPNWDIVASAERKKSGMPASLFEKRAEAENYGKTGDTTRNFWSDDPFENKMDPYWKRLPVFNRDGNLIETAVVSDLVNESGKKVDEDFLRKMRKRQVELQEKKRNINIVFVIDGTQSMGPYFNSVKSALRNTVRNLYNSDNRFRFGAVVYRDYTNPENTPCFNTISLSNNVERFSRELESCNTNDPSCFDNSDSEGMNMGLYMTRILFRGKEKESNMIILVGDAGDRKEPKRILEEDVVPVLVGSRVNFVAVQVNHRKNQAYEDFIFQVRDLILKSAEKIVSEEKSSDLFITGQQDKPVWKQESSQGLGFFTMMNSPLTGGIQYVSAGSTISEQRTGQIIEKMISDMNINTDTLLKKADNYISGIEQIDPTKIGNFTPAVKLFLRDAGYTNEEISLLTRKNYQFLLKTYTSFAVEKLKSPIYNFDIFLDSEELNDLITSLNKIYTPGLSGYQRRQNFRDAWFEVLRSNYGVSRDEIESKTFSEIMNLISGLPSPNPLLSKYTFDDIIDLNKLPDREFDLLLNDIKEKSELLTKITGNRQFYFLSNDRAYYWIPQSYLP